MRKLLEAINTVLAESTDIEKALAARIAQGDKGAVKLRFAIQALQQNVDEDAAVDRVFRAVETLMPEMDTDSVDFWDALYSMQVWEARQGGKTEHSGAKKGKGAYYGRKKDAKKDSNKARRAAGQAAVASVGIVGENIEETFEVIEEGRRFVNSAAMARWMLGALRTMQTNYGYGYEGDEAFHDLMSDIDDLVEDMENAEVSIDAPGKTTHSRPRGR